MNSAACPRCGTAASALQPMDGTLIAKLREAGNVEVIPNAVCENCYNQLAGTVARGSLLLAREKAKEQKKLMLWKSRVGLIKKARGYMRDKMFSDAAVSYEKYFKVMEIVFDCPASELTPEHFKDSARTQELTVVASAYWDLLRIYDTSPKYGDRQANVARKLAQFLKFTPIYPDIIRRAEVFEKTARNPAVLRSFLKSCRDNKGRCFIATAAFDSPEALEVLQLCQFRDQILVNTNGGRKFIQLYYKYSPRIAFFLDNNAWLKPSVRKALRPIAWIANRATRHRSS